MFYLLGQGFSCQEHMVEEAWKSWVTDATTSNIRALPLLICWGTWLARNSSIFHDKPNLEVIATQYLSILSHFPREKGRRPSRTTQEELMDCSRPWAFFDGASQNRNQSCGGGAVLHLSDHVS
jgi:hypothetical protein